MNADLMQEIENLTEIPEPSARAYKEHLGELVEKVNSLMLSRPDLRMLIGENRVGAMLDNHRNHALFMSNVFSLGAWGVLVKTVPWVYRTYHNHGFDYAYFTAHLEAWHRVLGEFLPPGDAAPLLKVYEWMLSSHEDFIKEAEVFSPVLPEPAPEWKDMFEEFVKGLLSGESRACMEIAARAVNSAASLADFYLNVIQPAMYTVGRKWETGEISIAAEHLASAIVNRVMFMQYLEFMEEPDEPKGKVVITAGANEFHEIGCTMLANVLEANGWEVDYLGANTPAGDFLEFISDSDFDIVAISVTMVFNLEYIREVIEGIRSWPGQRQPWIMVGGRVFIDSPELADKLGADGYAADCKEAAGLADRWVKKKQHENI